MVVAEIDLYLCPSGSTSLFISCLTQGEQLTPLDYVREQEAPEVAELLRANGALTSAEILPPTVKETVGADLAEVAGQSDAVEGVAKEESEETEAAKLVLPVRPASPSKQSLEKVVFESEEISGDSLRDSRESALAPRRPSAKSLNISHVSVWTYMLCA